MEELKRIFEVHAQKYPKMEPTDAVKLIYQNEFGGGHLIRNEAACLEALRQEYESVEQVKGTPLFEDIGNGIVRVMLAALEENDYPLERLGQAFLQSAAEHHGTMKSFLKKLELLQELTQAGLFRFSPPTLEEYLSAYAKANYPMVSHSAAYREAYHPAYRVVRREYLQALQYRGIGQEHQDEILQRFKFV